MSSTGIAAEGPRLRREGHAERPQGVHRSLPHRRCRVEATEYTIGLSGRVTLHQARLAAQKVFSAKVEGRDLAAEKREARRRVVADQVEDLLETFITQRAQNRSAGETTRLLRREVGSPWAGRSIHEITKRDVVEVILAIEQRGAPSAANKALKSIKTFLRWCVGRAILDEFPAEGVPLPAKEVARDRVLNAQELAQVILAARKMGGPYGGIVEFLACHRAAARRGRTDGGVGDELDVAQRIWTLPKSRTKNAKEHVVHLSAQSLAVLQRVEKKQPFVFSVLGTKPFQEFTRAKRRLDELTGITAWRLHDLRRTCVSGMARLGVAPHVADKNDKSPVRDNLRSLRLSISATSSSRNVKKVGHLGSARRRYFS